MVKSEISMKCFTHIILILTSQLAWGGEIALTFDDAPTQNSTLMPGSERTKLLIEGLVEAQVPDALFFVKTSAITPSNQQRLIDYVNAGFHLGNHSHNHKSAKHLTSDEYLQDVKAAQVVLNQFGSSVLPYHRFPFLHYGETQESIYKIQSGLAELGYKNGYVTVDNFDWYMDSLVQEAKKLGKSIDYEKLGNIYVETMWETIEFYDQVAQNTLGRSPRHVLLLHENDLAALYISKLVEHIRNQGWKIISPQHAYADPIAEHFPAGTFHNQGRVAAIAHEKGIPADQLRSNVESQDSIKSRFDSAGVFH